MLSKLLILTELGNSTTHNINIGNIWLKMSLKKPSKFALFRAGFQTQNMYYEELNYFSNLEDVKHIKH